MPSGWKRPIEVTRSTNVRGRSARLTRPGFSSRRDACHADRCVTALASPHMMLREIVLLLYQAVLFGIGTAGLAAHLGGALIAGAFGVDELIPTAIIFFAVAALLGWIGNRFWPETWMPNPFL